MRVSLLAVGLLLLGAGGVSAQDTVRVRGVYQPGFRPSVVVLPVTAALDSIQTILARDLQYSDRFDTVVVVPPAVGPRVETAPATINYALYRLENVNFAVELLGQPGAVTVRLHDILTEVVKQEYQVPLDGSGVGEARMEVHRLSDEIVTWATGEQGIAASRILFLNRADSRVYRVDSDGAEIHALSPANVVAVSPAWAPDGGRFAYTQLGGEGPGTIILQSVATRSRIVVPTTTTGQNITPSFSPDGQKLIFSRMTEQSANLYAVNAGDLCCLERLTATRFAENLSPVYSPDSRRIAFVSNRTGSPQIYSMAADGTGQELLVPFDYGSGASYAPDWSPDGARVVFHREREGVPQIWSYDVGTRSLREHTSSGRNEDPSFAPDGRHVVFISNRAGRGQLHILDLATSRIRQLVTPGVARLPSWSRSLARGRGQ